MKQLNMAYTWLRIGGFFLCIISMAAVLILAEPQRLSYFSYLLFKNQELLKTCSIVGIFLGVFFLFYTSSKVSHHYLKIKLFTGSMKLPPDMIKKSIDLWFAEQKVQGIKLVSVNLGEKSKISLELKTSNLQEALYSIEDIEAKHKDFMGSNLGIHTPIDLQLFEL